MKRALVAIVAVSGTVFSVYVATSGTVAQQTADMDDAGIAPPNRNCTCPVRLDPDFAEDAGLKEYQRLLFPCVVTAMADGGRDVQMPPMPLQRVRTAIDVVDWTDCTLAASTLAVRQKWGTSQPFSIVAAGSRPWCRAKLPTLPCLLLDGGLPGDRNVSPCTTRAAPATCERVSGGSVYLGDSDEDL